MARTEPRNLPAAVDAVRQRIEEWRRTREKRTQMPEELWAAAASVAQAHGLWAVSRALRVNYQCLKTRCRDKGAGGSAAGEAAAAAGFVELGAPEVMAASGEGGAILELSRADGAKLTIRVATTNAFDLPALAAAFCNRGR